MSWRISSGNGSWVAIFYSDLTSIFFFRVYIVTWTLTILSAENKESDILGNFYIWNMKAGDG